VFVRWWCDRCALHDLGDGMRMNSISKRIRRFEAEKNWKDLFKKDEKRTRILMS